MILSRNVNEGNITEDSTIHESVLNRMIKDCDEIIYQLNEKIDILKDEKFNEKKNIKN